MPTWYSSSRPRSCGDLGGDRVDAAFQDRQLAFGGDERDHDLRHDRIAALGDLMGGLEDRARLHLVDLGIGNAEPAAAMAEHRVELVEFVRAMAQHRHADARGLGDLLQVVLGLRQEFVQRRIEQPDGERQAGHDLEELDEILALHRQKLVQRRAALLDGLREDHLAHGEDAVGIEEHVLGAAEPDALGAEFARGAGIERGLGVGADLEPADLVGPFHQRAEIAGQFRLNRRHRARDHLAGRAVEGDPVAGLQNALADG